MDTTARFTELKKWFGDLEKKNGSVTQTDIKQELMNDPAMTSTYLDEFMAELRNDPVTADEFSDALVAGYPIS